MAVWLCAWACVVVYLCAFSVPPIVSIAHGSLGFLTSFTPEEGRDALELVRKATSKPLEFTLRCVPAAVSRSTNSLHQCQ